MACELRFVHLRINQNRKVNIQLNKNKWNFQINYNKKTINVCIGSLRFLNSFVCKTCLVISSSSVWNALFCVRCCHSNGSWGDIRVRPLCSPTLFLSGDNTNKKEKISLTWKWGWMQTKESRWDLSLKRKENEADVYQLGCCYLETGLGLGDCFIMKTGLVSLLHLGLIRSSDWEPCWGPQILWHPIFWYIIFGIWYSLNMVRFAQQLVVTMTMLFIII